ncbi:MAG TPA: nuclear transport factor 2 family protein [Thermoanaerobaculia bacterium]|nr:nuclear transport factor 2 family protein [Thermoanaerobaculia bacterium]
MPSTAHRTATLVLATVLTVSAGCTDPVAEGNAQFAPAPAATEPSATTAPTYPVLDPEQARAEIRALLDAQVEAWNRGDLEAYMAGYWNSPELRFVSGGEVTHGWQETLGRYRLRYPDRSAMGTLSFVDVDVQPMGLRFAAAHGQYVLERDRDRPTGLFTLIVERRPEGWRIVHDHTSAGE